MSITEKNTEVDTSNANKERRPQEETRVRIVSLVVGDALCFIIFAAIGRGNHGEATGLAAIPQIVVTALPFLTGWFLVAPFVGAFRQGCDGQPTQNGVAHPVVMGAGMAGSDGTTRHFCRSRHPAADFCAYHPCFQYPYSTALALALCAK